MTSMQVQANNVLNAMDESKVATIIELYDKGLLRKKLYRNSDGCRRGNLLSVLAFDLNMHMDDAYYWLDWFNI